jgi:acyl-CoA synthetase (AMP-forming)/AMP-acid ligase II
VELLGRGSAVVNTGGEKVFPAEVEEVLLEHPEITDAVVFGTPDERFGERLIALAVLLAPAAPQPVAYSHVGGCEARTLVGSPTGVGGSVDAVGTNARFSRAAGVALNAARTELYVGDALGTRLRRVNLSTLATATTPFWLVWYPIGPT